MTTSNPLRQFFRQPAIYLRLPSGGNFWPANSLDMPTNGELPVFPMTAIDEITYRTPDALFNGQAVVNVVESCVPNIKNAWHIPSQDFNAVMVAIRIASYGHEMDIGTQCPACDAETDFGLDLRTVIDRLAAGDYSKPLIMGDLSVSFRPLDYAEITANSQYQFQQQKTLQALADTEVPDADRISQINAMMRQIMDLTIASMTSSILHIQTNNAVVSDPEHIREFVTNCDRDIFNRIRDTVVQLRTDSELKPLKLRCPACQHQYEQAFTMDMSRFFASDS